MNEFQAASRKPLRLWPGVTLAVALVLIRLVAPLVHPEGAMIGLLGAVALGAAIGVWWLLFSRAPWRERLGAIGLIVVAVFATNYAVHESIRGGMMGRMLPLILAVPAMAVALVGWAVVSRRLAAGPRIAALVATVLLVCVAFTLIRTDGVRGGTPQLAWRWTPTAEERLLARSEPEPAAPTPAPAAPAPSEPAAGAASSASPGTASPAAPETAGARSTPVPDPANAAAAPSAARMAVRWPGFRGAGRDGTIRGVSIETDWTKSPPAALWRRPIGPGWSSFAVAGDLVFTQEQRGQDEIVSAYRLTTGEPVWRHRDAARFYESNGGPGPRGTPTFSNGRVYTLGATGILNALDAATGTVAWTRNAVTDTGATIPGWGIASSPLAIDDMVVVATSGRIAAYDAATGTPRWKEQTGGGGYSSPHEVIIDGVKQVVLLSGAGATSFTPADGQKLWQHGFWQDSVAMLQPAAVDGDLLIAGGDAMGGIGIRRIAVRRGPGGWTTEERWTSRGLKPYFSDVVIHKGHAFGFDGTILSCIDLKDGARKWKGGRYGSGQMVLLADQDLLLVISEEGELALVKAAPDGFTEVAPKFPAIEGKTWNHPVVVGDLLLLRNGQEMAAFKLPAAAGSAASATRH